MISLDFVNFFAAVRHAIAQIRIISQELLARGRNQECITLSMPETTQQGVRWVHEKEAMLRKMSS